jgi:hypothetical protein
VLALNLAVRTEENHEHLSQDSRFPGRYLNPGPREYEAEVLTIPVQRFVPLLKCCGNVYLSLPDDLSICSVEPRSE